MTKSNPVPPMPVMTSQATPAMRSSSTPVETKPVIVNNLRACYESLDVTQSDDYKAVFDSMDSD